MISRNDPCPCGSGAKYKRCCLEKDEAEARRKAAEERAALPVVPEPTEEDWAIEDELDDDPTLAAAVDKPFDEDVAPWELACFAEQHPTFAKARARDAAWAATPSLPREVEALSDDALRARLDSLGVTDSPDAFRAAARAALERGRP
ncbi:MAG: SEC-C metal-binding domain-containing protein, partial [Planctomycetota bacterium]